MKNLLNHERRGPHWLQVLWLMADKSNAGQAGPEAAVAGEGLIWGRCRSFTVFPPLPFVIESGPAQGFQGEDSLVMQWCQASQVVAWARVHHWWWSLWQAPTNLFRMHLKCFFGALLLRWSVERLPNRVILGKWWSSILEMCPAQCTCSCDFISMASMLEISTCSSTRTLVIKFLHWILRIVQSRQHWWKHLRSRTMYKVIHDSGS